MEHSFFPDCGKISENLFPGVIYIKSLLSNTWTIPIYTFRTKKSTDFFRVDFWKEKDRLCVFGDERRLLEGFERENYVEENFSCLFFLFTG
jgi:hypothetical protein